MSDIDPKGLEAACIAFQNAPEAGTSTQAIEAAIRAYEAHKDHHEARLQRLAKTAGVELVKRVEAHEASIHELFKTGDPDAPAVIKDRNGEVVLGLCRKCGRAEVELSEPCHEASTLPDEVERVAAVLCEKCDGIQWEHNKRPEWWRNCARAAIAAMEQAYGKRES